MATYLIRVCMADSFLSKVSCRAWSLCVRTVRPDLLKYAGSNQDVAHVLQHLLHSGKTGDSNVARDARRLSGRLTMKNEICRSAIAGVDPAAYSFAEIAEVMTPALAISPEIVDSNIKTTL